MSDQLERYVDAIVDQPVDPDEPTHYLVRGVEVRAGQPAPGVWIVATRQDCLAVSRTAPAWHSPYAIYEVDEEGLWGEQLATIDRLRDAISRALGVLVAREIAGR